MRHRRWRLLCRVLTVHALVVLGRHATGLFQSWAGSFSLVHGPPVLLIADTLRFVVVAFSSLVAPFFDSLLRNVMLGHTLPAGSVRFHAFSYFADELSGGLRVLLRVLAYDVVPGGAVHLWQGLLFVGASLASSLGL